jgi:hypothetical protein
MNRKLLSLVTAGALMVTMGGCSQEATGDVAQEEATQVSTEASEENDSAQIETSADAAGSIEVQPLVINFEGMSLVEMRAFILANMEHASFEEMDKMVVLYDQALTEEFWPLFEEFTFGEHFNAINETKDADYKLHIENIKDDAIKQDVEDAIASGYTFTMAEGQYYLARDYEDIYATFGIGLSEATRPYYEIRMREAVKPVMIEEYLSIDSKELMDRGLLLESFIKENPNFVFRDDVKKMLSVYVNGLLRVDPFSNTTDYETGKVNSALLAVYDLIKESDSEVLKAAVIEVDALLEANDYKVKMSDQEANDAINALKVKYMDQVAELVDSYYPTAE